MSVLNKAFIFMIATASTLALTGCLGTNTPASPGATINLSSAGSVFNATRGAGFEDMTVTAAAGSLTGATIGTDLSSAGFTSTGSLAGFVISIPADASSSATADTAVISSGNFATISQAVFPTHTQQASITTTGTHPILIDKFGTSQGLQDTEYGMWLEPGALTTTAATTAGVFAIGVPSTAMPTSGSAVYTGGASGVAANTITGTTTAGVFSGTATMTANFSVGGGTITGAVTGIHFSTAGSGGAIAGTMNDINMSGGTIAGNTFSGPTIAAGGTAGTGLDITGANTGKFGGTFTGTGAQEVAGTFQLSGGGNSAVVIGSFGAKR